MKFPAFSMAELWSRSADLGTSSARSISTSAQNVGSSAGPEFARSSRCWPLRYYPATRASFASNWRPVESVGINGAQDLLVNGFQGRRVQGSRQFGRSSLAISQRHCNTKSTPIARKSSQHSTQLRSVCGRTLPVVRPKDYSSPSDLRSANQA